LCSGNLLSNNSASAPDEISSPRRDETGCGACTSEATDLIASRTSPGSDDAAGALA
jgi:hypothetical protein